MPKRKPTIYILHGFCEGERSSHKLRAELTAAGFTICKNVADADIIIAHSAGCLLVPPDTAAKLVVLIGLTHNPSTPITTSWQRKLWEDMREYRQQYSLWKWLGKTWWNGVYFWNMPRNLRMLRAYRQPKWPNATQLLLIRNAADVFCTSQPSDLPETITQHAALLSLPGGHDNCWHNPAPYAVILKVYYERLLATANE